MPDMFHNRISELFPGPPKSHGRRSPAQQAASRQNGSRSRGPVTPEGVSRSRGNAIKHGLLARVIAPPSDIRHQDRLYRLIRQQLIEEFQPATFTVSAAIDALAHDYLQLARAKAMIEVLQRPPALSDEDAKNYERHQADRRDLRVIEQVLSRLSVGQRMNCKVKPAGRLAARLVKYLESVREYLAPNEDRLPESEMSEDEKQELRQIEEEWKLIEPHEPHLADVQHLTVVFRGKVRPKPAEMDVTQQILAKMLARLNQAAVFRTNSVRRVASCADAGLGAMSRAPESLLLLNRYQAKLDRQIDRKLRSLQRK